MKKLLNKKGFTIVELVIVIAVIAILAAVLIPTFSNVIESANETATMQEAKNSLDSYVGLMSSKGKSINNGTVFVVFDKDSTAKQVTALTNADIDKVSGMYVYYSGGLHKVNAEETLKTGAYNAPADSSDYEITIDSESHKVNYHISFKDQADFSGQSDYEFYFYNAPITFDEGSAKCRVFGGRIVANKIDYTKMELALSNNANGKAKLTKLTTENTYDLVIKTTGEGETAEFDIVPTTTPANGVPTFEGSLNKLAGVTLENAKIKVAANTNIPEGDANNAGTITVTLKDKGYDTGDHTITITINVKLVATIE